MSETVSVSVIMPSLNVAAYIEACVRSVMRQTLKDIEIICVDAGSTDGTAEILQKLAGEDGRIRLIRSEKKSYGYQMNLGIREAKGAYIGIVETDDFVSDDMFQTLYTAAARNSAEVVKANHFRFSGAGADGAGADPAGAAGHEDLAEGLAGLPYGQIFSPADHPALFLSLPSIWNGIYRKDFLKKNGISFLESPGASYQDTGFIIKVWACASRVYLLREAFYHYRTDNENSSVNSASKVYCVCDEFASVEAFLAGRPDLKKKYADIICARKMAAYLWNYQRLGDRLRLDFLYRIRPELLRDKEEGLLTPESSKPYMREMARQIIEAPELYYFGHRDRKEHLFGSDREEADLSGPLSAVLRNPDGTAPLISVILRVRDCGSRTGELLLRTAASLRQPEKGILPEDSGADNHSEGSGAADRSAQAVSAEILLYSDEITEEAFRQLLPAADTGDMPVWRSGMAECLRAAAADRILITESGDLYRRDLYELLEKNTACDLLVFNGLLYGHRDEEIRKSQLLSGAVLQAAGSRGKEGPAEVFDFCSGNKVFARALAEKVLLQWEEAMSGTDLHPEAFGFLGWMSAEHVEVLSERAVFKDESLRRAFPLVTVFKDLWQYLHVQKKTDVFERQFCSALAERAADTAGGMDFSVKQKLSKELRACPFAENPEKISAEGMAADEDSRAFLAGLLGASVPLRFSGAHPQPQKTADRRPVGLHPKVSVIIPVYNTEDYLEECIGSLQRQTLQDIEIICVNDGSSDASPEILRRLADEDERIVILEQNNCGQSAARNTGVSAAQGEYLYFIDSDDWLEEHALEKLFAVSRENALDVLFFEGDVIYESRELRENSPMPRDNYRCRHEYPGLYTGVGMLLAKDRYGEYRVSPCMQMIRRAFYEENALRFHEGIYYEDNLFVFEELLAASRVMHMREALYMRRIAADSTTSGGVRFEHPYGYYTCFRLMSERLKTFSCEEETKAGLYAVVLRVLGNAVTQYKNCSPSERERYLSLTESERYDFYTVVVRAAAGDLRGEKIKAEKAELGRKLQKTYDEKAERGIRIRQLEEELAHTLTARAKRAGKKLLKVPAKIRGRKSS